MRAYHSYRQRSKENWGETQEEGESLTVEKIQLGAVLRIADATEAMAKRHVDLIDEAARLRRDLDRERGYQKLADYRLRAAKGQITKLKRQLAARPAQVLP